MPPRLPLRPLKGGTVLGWKSQVAPSRPVCLLCSLASSTTTQTTPEARNASNPRRFQSTATAPKPAADARAELIDILIELQKTSPGYINLSRLQLALQGLRQAPGQEFVRVAILGLVNGVDSGKTAKDLLRVLLSDALSPEAEWERELENHDPRHPLVVRVRQPRQTEEPGTLRISKTNLLHELEISCPGLNDLQLELLLTEVSPFAGDASGIKTVVDKEETLLVPTVDIPSNTGRFNAITTPVHKALVVSHGIMGAASVTSLPILQDKDTVLAVVDLPGYSPQDPDVTFQPIDIATASKGIRLFRESLGNAMEYQRLVNQSNLPALLSWLRTGVKADEPTTKPAVRKLIASMLQASSAAVHSEESRLVGKAITAGSVPGGSAGLNRGLAQWSQSAHEELQQQLDLAFTGRRWRRLGWWKLFWRVDDVELLTNDILAQRFLPSAERELVYLAGRIEEAKAATGDVTPSYSQPAPETQKTVETAPAQSSVKWPTHISFTRRYLHAETVPALQALAQRLVVQASSTSFLASSLSGLLYFWSPATTLYEAGVVAAVGIVWSLRRMQKRWDAARDFWEGEVREEGRKAVRGTESSVAEALEGKTAASLDDPQDAQAREQAKELISRANDALARLK
ncbi:hypothetical protein F5X68DRAFT_65044 [Plectosphaerella plurivora]|uniref:Mmc1 C-terminal domain-containing protein n=1 Tax=Plectosphaerella plurivora TaxID=936078 RepID=A0A9P9AEB1_9PEZI|nr:hypothetical protein F5X68DRAFT_65044 [Plectosphaerella plurivora]